MCDAIEEASRFLRAAACDAGDAFEAALSARWMWRRYLRPSALKGAVPSDCRSRAARPRGRVGGAQSLRSRRTMQQLAEGFRVLSICFDHFCYNVDWRLRSSSECGYPCGSKHQSPPGIWKITLYKHTGLGLAVRPVSRRKELVSRTTPSASSAACPCTGMMLRMLRSIFTSIRRRSPSQSSWTWLREGCPGGHAAAVQDGHDGLSSLRMISKPRP